MKPRSNVTPLTATAALLAALLLQQPARAQPGASDASAALSLLPVAVSVVAPSALLVGSTALTLLAVEASAEGTVWVLQRASDGARVSIRFSGQLAQGASIAAGTAVSVVALASGYVLSAAGQAIAFIPNEIGASLLYNERITR